MASTAGRRNVAPDGGPRGPRLSEKDSPVLCAVRRRCPSRDRTGTGSPRLSRPRLVVSQSPVVVRCCVVFRPDGAEVDKKLDGLWQTSLRSAGHGKSPRGLIDFACYSANHEERAPGQRHGRPHKKRANKWTLGRATECENEKHSSLAPPPSLLTPLSETRSFLSALLANAERLRQLPESRGMASKRSVNNP